MIRFFWDMDKKKTSIPLISAVLHHNEGKPAVLSMTVLQNTIPFSEQILGQWGTLIYQSPEKKPEGASEESTIFYGKITEFIEKKDEVDIVLVSERASVEEQKTSVFEEIKAMGRHCDLWAGDSLDTFLTSVPYTYYWDRCTGAMGISHAYKGKKTWDVSPHYDPKYRLVQKKQPLSQVVVQVSALWEQSMLGYVDVAPHIAAHFPKGVIGTLTDKSLEAAWPEVGRFFPSGYFVAHSMLNKKPPSPYYPRAVVFSAPQVDHSSPPAPRWLAECSFYDAKLVLGYFYRQKRKETLQYTLKSSLFHPDQGRTETLDITLPPFLRYTDLPLWNPMMDYEKDDVVQHQGRVYRYDSEDSLHEIRQRSVLQRTGFKNSPACWVELPEQTKWLFPSISPSFFTETLGQELFQYTLHRAKTALIWGSRCMEIQVRGALKYFHAISLDDAIILNKDDKSDTKITGKVVGYTLHMDGIQQTAYVQIKAAFFMHSDPSVAESNTQEHPALHPLDFKDYTFSQTHGLRYAWPKQDPPMDIVSQNIKKNQLNICKRIQVFNPIDQQLDHLEKMKKKMWGNEWDPSYVQSKETRIRMDFYSLRTTECLNHTINAHILDPYTPGSD